MTLPSCSPGPPSPTRMPTAAGQTNYRDSSGRLTGTQYRDASGRLTGIQRDASGRLIGSSTGSGKAKASRRCRFPHRPPNGKMMDACRILETVGGGFKRLTQSGLAREGGFPYLIPVSQLPGPLVIERKKSFPPQSTGMAHWFPRWASAPLLPLPLPSIHHLPATCQHPIKTTFPPRLACSLKHWERKSNDSITKGQKR